MLATLVTVVLASCGYFHSFHRSGPATSVPKTWNLLVAPFTREFPHGDLHAPLSKWSVVKSLDTAAGCDAILEQAEDYLQRPVLCIASDDPRLKESSTGPDARP